MTGRCVGDDANVANTNWAACLVAENNEENGNCPHGFPKIENVICGRGHTRIPPFKNLVCCVVSPVIDVKVNRHNEKHPKTKGFKRGESAETFASDYFIEEIWETRSLKIRNVYA